MLALLVGCTGEPDKDPDGIEGARNGLNPVLASEAGADVLQVRVAQVLFEASDGPEGPVQVSIHIPEVLDASGRAEGPVLDLPTGTYDDAHLVVTLDAGDGADALWASGTLDEVDWTVIVEQPLAIEARESTFQLGYGPDVEVVFTFDTEQWFDEVEVEDLEEEGEVVLSEGDAGYAKVVAEIAGTEGRFPEREAEAD